MKILIFLTMAYLNMISRVTIGHVVLFDINSFSVKESVSECSDTATIVFPFHYKKIATNSVLNFIRPGLPVEIEAGYNGKLRTVYKGFVREVNADMPVTVECDELYNYRQNNIYKSYRSVTLRDLLAEHFSGLSIECPEVVLGKLLLDHISSYELLERIKRDYGLYSRVYDNKILHVAFAYDWQPGYTKIHDYIIQDNVKKNDLKFKRKEDFNTRIKVTIIKGDGSKAVKNFGSTNENAATNSITVFNKTETEAKQLAEGRLRQVSYDGYEGSITGFGIPRVHAGDSVNIVDNEKPELEGRYLAESVEIEYGPGGYQRSAKLAFKL